MCIVALPQHTDQTVLPQEGDQTAASDCPAHRLTPAQRRQLALDALAGQSISLLAEQRQVSRKFVYQQLDIAHDALERAFAPVPDEKERVLFYLPVTRSWIRQLVLALVLICRLRRTSGGPSMATGPGAVTPKKTWSPWTARTVRRMPPSITSASPTPSA